MIDQSFGEWKVLSLEKTDQRGHWYLCRCSCGNTKVVLGMELRRGKSKSCGHNGSTFKHGQARRGKKLPEYNVWVLMRERCSNSTSASYPDYGGRGIRVCSRWDEFENFLADMGLRPFVEATIERNDNNGNYEPSNCRWATRAEQRRNTRRIISVTHDGVTMCLKDWCEHIGLPYMLIYRRVRCGVSPVEALFGKGGQSKL